MPGLKVPKGYEEYKKRALKKKKLEEDTEWKTKHYIV